MKTIGVQFHDLSKFTSPSLDSHSCFQEAVKAEELPAKDVEMKDVTNTEYTEEMKLEGAEEGGAEKKKPSWLNRSKEGGIKKLPKEVVRRRRNFRLKKMLTPKVLNPTWVLPLIKPFNFQAPIMVLNELLGQTKVIYEVIQNYLNFLMFLVSLILVTWQWLPFQICNVIHVVNRQVSFL